MDENNNEKRIQGELEELINTWTSQIIEKFSKSSEELKAKLADKITMLCRNEQELGESKKMLKELLNCYTELSSRFREQTHELDTVKAELARITGTARNDEASDYSARVKDEPVVIIENEDESHKIKANVLDADERTVTTVSSTNLSTSTHGIAENKTALNAESSSTTATTTNFLPIPAQSARSFVLNATPNNQVAMQKGNHKIVTSTKVINTQNTPIPKGVTVLQSTNNQSTQPHKPLPLTQSHPQLKSILDQKPITNSYIATISMSDKDTNKKSTNGYTSENNNNQSSNGSDSDDDIMLIDDDEEKFPLFTSNNSQGALLTELYKMSPSVEAFACRLLKYYFTVNELTEQHTTVDGLSRNATLRSLDQVRIGYIYRHVTETTGRTDKTLWAKCTNRMSHAINRVRKKHIAAPSFPF